MVRRQDPREARCLFSSFSSTAISPWLSRSLALGPDGRMKRSIIKSKRPSPTSSSNLDLSVSISVNVVYNSVASAVINLCGQLFAATYFILSTASTKGRRRRHEERCLPASLCQRPWRRRFWRGGGRFEVEANFWRPEESEQGRVGFALWIC